MRARSLKEDRHHNNSRLRPAQGGGARRNDLDLHLMDRQSPSMVMGKKSNLEGLMCPRKQDRELNPLPPVRTSSWRLT